MKKFLTNLLTELKQVSYIKRSDVFSTSKQITVFLIISMLGIVLIDYVLTNIRNIIIFI